MNVPDFEACAAGPPRMRATSLEIVPTLKPGAQESEAIETMRQRQPTVPCDGQRARLVNFDWSEGVELDLIVVVPAVQPVEGGDPEPGLTIKVPQQVPLLLRMIPR